jgi:hypothetical protein
MLIVSKKAFGLSLLRHIDDAVANGRCGDQIPLGLTIDLDLAAVKHVALENA